MSQEQFGTDLARVVASILARFSSEPPRDHWEHRIAREMQVVPLGVDFLYYVVLHPDGHLTYVELLDRNNWHKRSMDDPAALSFWLRRGARRYSELREALTRWGSVMPPCAACSGSGRVRRRLCQECGGLGWVAHVEPEEPQLPAGTEITIPVGPEGVTLVVRPAPTNGE